MRKDEENCEESAHVVLLIVFAVADDSCQRIQSTQHCSTRIAIRRALQPLKVLNIFRRFMKIACLWMANSRGGASDRIKKNMKRICWLILSFFVCIE